MKYIIAIDISSTNIKVGLISDGGKLVVELKEAYFPVQDGEFGIKFDIPDMWAKILNGIKFVIGKSQISKNDIIAISSDVQRIAIAFLDENNEVIYSGPNKDARGVDSQYIIDDTYCGEEGECELFGITAHCPPLVFGLARYLWFREEDPENYERIKKIVMLDDWIQFKLSGNIVSDPSIASESQFLDVPKRIWSQDILSKFEINPDLLPPLIECATITGKITKELANELGLNENVVIVKSGPDTQTSLIGMGCIEPGDIGIPLGTTAPVMLVMSEPKIDPKLSFWTCCNPVPNSWIMEANSGMTGMIYDWFKDNMLIGLSDDLNALCESYIQNTKPGANNTFAFLGPQKMNFKNTTDIKRSVFIFPSHSSISDIISDRSTFTRALLENIGFGILENFNALLELAPNNKVNKVFCGGGMANSKGFVKIIADILGQDIFIPKIKESAYVGQLINCMIALGTYKNHREAVDSLVELEVIKHDEANTKEYKKIYGQWKIYKEKTDNL